MSKINQSITLTIDSHDINSSEFKGIINHLILNFKIIQNINIADKISIHDNNIYIDEGTSILQGAYRWWYSSNRENTISELTRILDKFNNYLLYLNNSKRDINKTRNITVANQKKIELINFYINSLKNEIPDLIKGLENLKETYIEDETLVKKINILIKGFNSQLDMT
tara:strand:+ start:1014 stop:1517 length:504 start_codon:yes stop_codon:yes gene_type:complete